MVGLQVRYRTLRRSGMKPTDRNPVTETRHRDQNFYPGLQDKYVFNFDHFGLIL